MSLRSVQRILETDTNSAPAAWTPSSCRMTRNYNKLKDVVGLYLDPPDKALVLCVDEKSQIQALDRTQPGLPIKKGRAGTMTHDYKRNGTTTLFAALDVATGKVIGECMPRHRHQEFLRFLRTIDRNTPKHFALDLVVDNYATHKHPKVREWLARIRAGHSTSPRTSRPGPAVEGLLRQAHQEPSARRVSFHRHHHPLIRRRPDSDANFVDRRSERVLHAVKRGKQALKSIHYRECQ